VSDYPKEFEDVWLKPVPARTGNRKEAGYVVYCRMNKRITELEERLQEAEILRQSEVQVHFDFIELLDLEDKFKIYLGNYGVGNES